MYYRHRCSGYAGYVIEIVSMLHELWQISLSLAPWLVVGMAITGLLHSVLPPNFLKNHLTGKGSVLKAVILGVPMPLCSCGVIPAGLGLKKDGASDGAALGFLISTPQTGVDSIMVSASFLGWPFALFKVVSAFVTGLVGGLLANQFSNTTVSTIDDADSQVNRSWRDGVSHAIQVLRSIWKWLVFGIVTSALISSYLPEESMVALTSAGPLVACLGVLILSTPLYVCATASVPIAAALVGQGLPMSAALVFLMAGPATNVATIGAIYRGFGKRNLLVYLGTIILGSLGFGLAFESFISVTKLSPGIHEHTSSWWEQVSAVALYISFVWFAYEELRGFIASNASTPTGEDEPLILDVSGMTCGGCVGKLERAFQKREDVSAINVSLEPGQAVIHGKIAREEARGVITEAGFKTS